MKILILGATERTGKLILVEALNKGYYIHCLVREPNKIVENHKNHKNHKIYKGSPEQVADLENAIQGCKGIISLFSYSEAVLYF